MEDKSDLDRSMEIKNKGNKFFMENKYQKSIELYTKALQVLGFEHEKSSILFSNRAYAHIRLENYGAAVIDADQAIKVNPRYAKGYYRKSSALYALGKLKDAIKQLVFLVKKLGMVNNKDINRKLKFLKNFKKLQDFTACLDYKDDHEKCDETKLVVSVDYNGPVLEQDSVIDLQWVKKLLEFLKKQ